jgi:YidC/Oxa1 family membrane protein insertase
MDRNSIIGLVMIGIILSVFTIFNQPSEEDIKAQEAKEMAAQKKAEQKADKEAQVALKAKVESLKNDNPGNFSPKMDKNGMYITKNKGVLFVNNDTQKDTLLVLKSAPKKLVAQKEIKGEVFTLENDLLTINFTNKGGMISEVYLKKYETYHNYAKKDNKITPLALFKDGDAKNELVFPYEGKSIHTGNKMFDVVKETKNSITFALTLENGETIEQIYTLKKGAYDIEYKINIKGFDGKVNKNQFAFNWETDYKKTERLFSEQRRVTTICYEQKKEGLDYLSEMADDQAAAEDDINWIAYKQSYFSSILKPRDGFQKDGTSFKIRNFKEGHEKAWTNLKGMKSTATLNVNNTNNATIEFSWFFGPNDYKLLKSYDSNYDDILNFGWGLFRWINLYAVQPVFDFLGSTGLSAGLAILFLTLILKFVLMPIQWKMYLSSAKMRILKPEIEELGKKYPNKEDAMKKQMETMTLYRESGASPLAGCVPMLIQMPILLAVFRFFPSAFELRQQPFLWAEDLSSYDSIWDFGMNLWPYGDHMSLFTLLMAGTTLVYTVMNGGQMQQPQQEGMPNMKVIMYIFPIMMIFFFNNYSAGLSYYYFISTLISILIMLAIKKFFVDEEKLKLKMAERKAANAGGEKVKKKSKFQERLEQMQRAQQEQMKNKKK